MKLIKCLGCNSSKCHFLFSLGEMPPVNAFRNFDVAEENFPLNLFFCESCGLVQLGDIVPPERLFSNYLHLSSGSIGNIRHLKNVSMLLDNLGLVRDKKILEIGSNDGSLLELLKRAGAEVLGVDPAENLVKNIKSREVDSIVGFFDDGFASAMQKDELYFDTIVALNVIAHTPTFISALNGVKRLLMPNGTFFMENAYVLDTILDGQFDTIYHEHIFCFSLHALIKAYASVGLKAIDAEIIPTQGKSIRVFVKHDDAQGKVSQRLNVILEHERYAGFNSLTSFETASLKIKQFKKSFTDYINKHKGEKFIGLGAPARGVVILNYCDVNETQIKFIIDDTELKQGKLTPGCSIPVKGWDAIDPLNDHHFIALSWNYAEDMIDRLRKLGVIGKVLIPFPSFEEIII